LFFALNEQNHEPREAPTPTNISTKSDPLMLKNGHPGFSRNGASQQSFAGPGSAHEQTALGILPPSLVNFFGSFRKAMISADHL